MSTSAPATNCLGSKRAFLFLPSRRPTQERHLTGSCRRKSDPWPEVPQLASVSCSKCTNDRHFTEVSCILYRNLPRLHRRQAWEGGRTVVSLRLVWRLMVGMWHGGGDAMYGLEMGHPMVSTWNYCCEKECHLRSNMHRAGGKCMKI